MGCAAATAGGETLNGKRRAGKGRACGRGWLLLLLLLGSTIPVTQGYGEYGDVILNNRSEQQGERPVIFPHWFHRIRFQCRVCHTELGFQMRAGANDLTMDEISSGKFCGACHNGEVAWAVDNCGLCHSGRPGLATGILGGHETLGPGNW